MSDIAKCRKNFVEAVFKHLWMAGEVSTEQRDNIPHNFQNTPYYRSC